MKKLLLMLAGIFGFVGSMMAEQTELFSVAFTDTPSKYTSAYNSSFTQTNSNNQVWTLANINNGQKLNDFAEWRLGKTANVATITTNFSSAEAVNAIGINFTTASATDMGSIKVKVSASNDFSSPKATYTFSGTLNVGEISIEITDPQPNMYYQVEMTPSTESNGKNRFDKIIYYGDSEGGNTGGGGETTDPDPKDPVDPQPGDDDESVTATLNTTTFSTSGTAYAKFNYNLDGIYYTSVFAPTSSTMQFNTNNGNGKASAIVVNKNESGYIIESIDVTLGTAGKGVNIYSYTEGFGDLTLGTAPTIPDAATQVESALTADKQNIVINAPAFAIYPAGSGVIQVSSVTVHYKKAGGGTTDPDPVDPQPGDDDDAEEVTQPWTNTIGFPTAKADAPTTGTKYTATNTGLEYEIMGCYTNSGYLFVNGKDFAGAYISWTLDYPIKALKLTTSGGASTNADSKVNVYANGNPIETGLVVNAINTTYTVIIPEEYQEAGTVYKVESGTKSYNQQFSSFTYVKAPVAAPEGTVATPVIKPSETEVAAGTEIEITCATEGATIYYQIDESPEQEYNPESKPTITVSCTVKARATMEGMTDSDVATRTYTVLKEATSIANLYEVLNVKDLASGKTTTESAIVGFEPVVTYVNGANVYVRDEEGNSTLIYVNNSGLAAGDKIAKGWKTAVQNYSNGLYELIPAVSSFTKTNVGAPEPETMTADQITADSQSKYILLNKVVFEEDTPAGKATFYGTMGGQSVTFYNGFTVESVEAGKYNVTAIVSIYSGNVQVQPTAYEKYVAENQAPEPTFSPNPKDGPVEIGTVVTISCSDPDATIWYEFGDDMDEYIPGETVIKLTRENFTVSAFTEKDDYEDSEVVTAEYTLCKVATPVFSYVEGPLPIGTAVTISCPTEGATIYYSVESDDDQQENVEDQVYEPGTTIVIYEGETFVMAYAVRENWLDSETADATYFSLDHNEAYAPTFTFDFSEASNNVKGMTDDEINYGDNDAKDNSMTNTVFTTVDGLSLTMSSNSYTAAPRWYQSNNGVCVRMYGNANGGNTATVTAPDGYALTEVEFTQIAKETDFNFAADNGTLSGKTWSAGTEEVNAVVFKATGATRFVTVDVTYERVAHKPVQHESGEETVTYRVKHGYIKVEVVSDENTLKTLALEDRGDAPTNWEYSEDGLSATYTIPAEDANKYHIYGVFGDSQSEPVVFTLDDYTSGIEGIEVDAENAVYYNLQGVRVNEPLAPGMYIRAAGSRATKVIVK